MSTPYVDPGFLVKKVIEGMGSTTAHAVPIAPTILATPRVSATTDNMVLLVRLVKSMREIDCKPCMGEQGAEIAGKWIRKEEKTMI
jgi:hypothetical protein